METISEPVKPEIIPPAHEPIKIEPAENLEVVTNGSEPAPDPDYFELSSPITVEDKTLARLRLNPRGVLRGKQFFALINRYQRKFPEEARNTLNKYVSENFLSLVLAEINGIAPEDLYKIDYADLPLLFLQAATFHFGAGRTEAKKLPAPEKSEP